MCRERLACGNRERQEGICWDNSPEGQGGDWSGERPSLSGLLTLAVSIASELLLVASAVSRLEKEKRIEPGK